MNNTAMTVANETQAREVAQIQARVTVAVQFPRDTIKCESKIAEACKHPGLAKKAHFSLDRKGSVISGPTIHLVTQVAMLWTNIEFGWRETERANGHSTIEVWAWDLENNATSRRTVIVAHAYDGPGGQAGRAVTSNNLIYEICANHAARRMRACIEAVLPRHLIDMASAICKKAIAKPAKGKTMAETKKELTAAFAAKGVTKIALEQFCQCAIAELSDDDMGELRTLYRSIVDGTINAETIMDGTTHLDRNHDPDL